MVYLPSTARNAGYWVACATNEQPCVRRGITALDPADSRRLRQGLEHAVNAGSVRAIAELIVRTVEQRLSLFEVLGELDALQLLNSEILQLFGACEWPAAPIDEVPA